MNAYHYTTHANALAILQSRIIRPATTYVPADETPVVWFSRARKWEPTAAKRLVFANGGRGATFAEMARIGLARFVIDDGRLLSWPELITAANIARDVVAALVRAGRGVGANPGDWCGVLESVPVANTRRVETYDLGRNCWRDFAVAELTGAAA
jgi:hypothetical protein